MLRKRSGALWTVEYRGADPFGGPILPDSGALAGIQVLGWAKERGYIDMFSAHDDDLVGWDPKQPEDYLDPKAPIHDQLAALKEATDKFRMPMNMATCSLHGHPIFTAGGFTNRDPMIRMLAIKKALRTGWIGNYFGAQFATYWTARDGFECTIADPTNLSDNPYVWLKQALNTVSAACRMKGFSIKHGTIEPKVNEPRGYTYLPLTGSALAFITTLDSPDFWGVNPEVPQHSSMGCQNPYLEIKQAAQVGKLFFIHVGGQIVGQFDDDFPMLVGESKETLILIFRFLDQIGWNGVIEFDCHALRSDLAPALPHNAEVFQQFLKHNAEMHALIEGILVPRIRTNDGLLHALYELDHPAHSEPQALDSCRRLLAQPVSGASIETIVATPVPAAEIMCTRQNHLAAERELNLALYGISEEELAAVMPQPEEATEAVTMTE